METLWQKLQWWKKPKMLEENKDYRFIDFKNSEITGIELLMEGYLGVVYHYNKVRVVEDMGIAKLEYGYTLVYAGEHDIDHLNSSSEFHTIMGDILTEILIKQQQYEPTRTDDFEELGP